MDPTAGCLISSDGASYYTTKSAGTRRQVHVELIEYFNTTLEVIKSNKECVSELFYSYYSLNSFGGIHLNKKKMS